MLIAWNGFLFASMLWSAYLLGPNMRLRGDALGVDIPLTWVGPAITGTLLAASVYWALRRPEIVPIARWRPHGRLMLAIALTLAPVTLPLSPQRAPAVWRKRSVGCFESTMRGWLLPASVASIVANWISPD